MHHFPFVMPREFRRVHNRRRQGRRASSSPINNIRGGGLLLIVVFSSYSSRIASLHLVGDGVLRRGRSFGHQPRWCPLLPLYTRTATKVVGVVLLELEKWDPLDENETMMKRTQQQRLSKVLYKTPIFPLHEESDDFGRKREKRRRRCFCRDFSSQPSSSSSLSSSSSSLSRLSRK